LLKLFVLVPGGLVEAVVAVRRELFDVAVGVAVEVVGLGLFSRLPH
jgi:hypothetical protein